MLMSRAKMTRSFKRVQLYLYVNGGREGCRRQLNQAVRSAGTSEDGRAGASDLLRLDTREVIFPPPYHPLISF